MAIRREDLKETNFRDVATGRRLAPVHPGEVLMKDFIEPMALVRAARSGRSFGWLTPGTGSGASGNQKNARLSPPPQSKKKCCPSPKGSSMVLTRGMPSTPS